MRQEPQLGTGHAVQQAVPLLHDDGIALILNGDVPLIGADTLQTLVASCGGERLALLSVEMPDPTGYGRILREGDRVRAIVEHKDATEAQRRLREVYTGFMAVPNAMLKRWLPRLSNQNAQREYYLTDIVELAVTDGAPVVAVAAADSLRSRRRQQPAAARATGASLPVAAGAVADGGGRAAGRSRRASTCAAACAAGRTWRSTSTACSRARCRSATA